MASRSTILVTMFSVLYCWVKHIEGRLW